MLFATTVTLSLSNNYYLALTQTQIFQDHRHQVILCYWQLMATK